MTDNLEKKVIHNIEKHNMVSPGDHIIVGLSGGKDSMSLLYFLHDYSKIINFNLYAVHVNHMLRGEESERDKRFTIKTCKILNIPCMVNEIDVNVIAKKEGVSVEEAGRCARHRAFETAVRKIEGSFGGEHIKVALAHHGDDNAETILLNLIRGAGVNGLSGMSPVATTDGLVIIRPFLCIGRDYINDYVKKKKISYVDDSTNFCDDYARNKIRLNVTPEFIRINSRALDHINETAEILGKVQDFLEAQTDQAFKTVAHGGDKGMAIGIVPLMQLDPIIRAGIIQRGINTVNGTLKDITRVHINEVLGLAEKQTGRSINLPYNMKAYRNYENIIIKKDDSLSESTNEESKHSISEENVELSLNEIITQDKIIELNDGKMMRFQVVEVNDDNRKLLIIKNRFTKAFDCDTIKGHLIFGNAKPDDELTIVGGKKKLKRFFTDEKIPCDERKYVQVLKDEESTLWVIGYRIGEAYKITDNTTRALKVDIIGGNNE